MAPSPADPGPFRPGPLKPAARPADVAPERADSRAQKRIQPFPAREMHDPIDPGAIQAGGVAVVAAGASQAAQFEGEGGVQVIPEPERGCRIFPSRLAAGKEQRAGAGRHVPRLAAARIFRNAEKHGRHTQGCHEPRFVAPCLKPALHAASIGPRACGRQGTNGDRMGLISTACAVYPFSLVANRQAIRSSLPLPENGRFRLLWRGSSVGRAAD